MGIGGGHVLDVDGRSGVLVGAGARAELWSLDSGHGTQAATGSTHSRALVTSTRVTDVLQRGYLITPEAETKTGLYSI